MNAGGAEVDDVYCAVFVALKEEFAPLVSQLESRRGYRREALRYTIGLRGGRKIALCRTGIGRHNATRKARALLEHVRPSVALVTGFAGGLATDWATGNCLVASRVTGEEESTSWDAPADLLGRALNAPHGHRVRTGHLVSVARVLRDPADKVRVGEELEAHGVDMESSGVLAVTTEAGIPTLCVRVILDDVSFDLPFDFGKIMNPEGELNPLKTLVVVGARPDKWPRLAELRRRAIAATAILETTVPRIIEAL